MKKIVYILFLFIMLSSCSLNNTKQEKQIINNNIYTYNNYNYENKVKEDKENIVINSDKINEDLSGCIIDDITFKETPKIPIKQIADSRDNPKLRTELLVNYITELRTYTAYVKKEHKKHMETLRKNCQK